MNSQFPISNFQYPFTSAFEMDCEKLLVNDKYEIVNIFAGDLV